MFWSREPRARIGMADNAQAKIFGMRFVIATFGRNSHSHPSQQLVAALVDVLDASIERGSAYQMLSDPEGEASGMLEARDALREAGLPMPNLTDQLYNLGGNAENLEDARKLYDQVMTEPEPEKDQPSESEPVMEPDSRSDVIEESVSGISDGLSD